MTATVYEFTNVDAQSLEPIYPEQRRTVQAAGAGIEALQLLTTTRHVFIKANAACNIRVGYDASILATTDDTKIATDATALFSIHRGKTDGVWVHVL